MTENRYCLINKNTFEVYEEHPEVFICDKEIADTISNLNKQGFETKACCAGHYEVGFIEQLNVDLSFLEEAKNDPKMIVREIREDGFDCWIEKTRAHIYVLFKEKYDFPSVPRGFSCRTNESTILEAVVEYYSFGKRKSKAVIEEEIKMCREALYWWTINLSKERERGR